MDEDPMLRGPRGFRGGDGNGVPWLPCEMLDELAETCPAGPKESVLVPESFPWDGDVLSLAKRCASTSVAGLENLFGCACKSGIRWNWVGLGIRTESAADARVSLPPEDIESCDPKGIDAEEPRGCIWLLKLSSMISCLIVFIVPCLVRTAYISQVAS